jgi:hypothetical protein
VRMQMQAILAEHSACSTRVFAVAAAITIVAVVVVC